MSAHTEAEDKLLGLLSLLSQKRTAPLYLQINEREDGTFEFRQVEFLTPAELAQLCKVETRTVYSWLDKGLITAYTPPGTGGKLFDLTESLAWIKSGGANGRPEDNC